MKSCSTSASAPNTMSISLLLVLAFASSPYVSAFNITKLLSVYPYFGAFNGLLTQTHLAEAANNRTTITVLALNNASISSISGRDTEELTNIIRNHIILDYFDETKIQGITRRSSIITTLYQTTGVAQDEQGFLNMTKLAPGVVVFGSAVKGSPLVAKLIRQVYSQPFNLSVLQVSTPIVAPGQGKVVLPPPPPPMVPPPASSPEDVQAPSPSDENDDYSSPESAPIPAEAPAPSSDAPADAPAPGKPKKKMHDADEDEGSASSRVLADMTLALGLVVACVATTPLS